nr:hypothetical protein [Tanacetum cinerariifolium]
MLKERREIAIIREARRKQQVEKYYNQRVHHKQFKVGEFVLQKNKLSKEENTGKHGPKWEGPYEVVKTYGTGAYKLRSMEDMTGISCFIAEHELKSYPYIESMVQRKQSIAPNRRRVVKDEVAEWIKAGIVRKNAGATFQRLVDTIFGGQIGRNLKAHVNDMVIKSKTQPEMIKDVEETLLTLKKESEQIQEKQRSCKKGSTLPKHPQKVCKQKGLSLDNRGRRSIPRNEDLITELPTLTTPKKEEELMVYLSAANEAVSAVILVERHGRQAPIHYVSRTLHGAEINYSPMEKFKNNSKNKGQKDACISRFKVGSKPCGRIIQSKKSAAGQIKEIHTGLCGLHDGPRRAVQKAMNAGYFLPCMHRDANNEISSCNSCQVYATVQKLPKNDMISVTSAWPF